jgi:energy-converting hydrogenase Eha subunit C
VDNTELFLASPWFSIACLLVVMVACIVGIIALAFHDTFLQRLAMGSVCLAGLVKVLYLAQAETADPAAAFIYVAMALYAVATAIKYWWRWTRAGRPDHPFRRSTDFGPEDAVSGMPGRASDDLRRAA